MAPTQRQQINALANLAQAASHAEWKPFEQPLLPKQPATFDANQLPPLPRSNARQDSPEEAGGQNTDVDALMDIVGNSGVDIGAEEEGMRLANERRQGNPGLGPKEDRSRRQDFIEPGVLAECVKKIAAAYQLRTLEPDTIPLIALAVRHRLQSLINDSVAARDHRITASHLKPPPFVVKPTKRDRSTFQEGDEDEMDEEDDEDEEYDEITGELKPKEHVAAWDHVVFDDQEKILGVLERVEREEERQKRRERMIRDQKETEERELLEAIAASEAAERALGGPSTFPTASLSTSGAPATPGSTTPAPTKTAIKAAARAAAKAAAKLEPPGSAALTPTGKLKKEPKAKKKKDGPSTTARMMSEDVRKRMADTTALRSVGGKSFSWMTGAAGGTGFGGGSPGTPSGFGKGKFAPASSLPAPNFATPSRSQPTAFARNPTQQQRSHPLSRMSNVPAMHDANRNLRELQEWERGKKQVELGDMLFALERERGMGVGKGSGSRSLVKAWSERK